MVQQLLVEACTPDSRVVFVPRYKHGGVYARECVAINGLYYDCRAMITHVITDMADAFSRSGDRASNPLSDFKAAVHAILNFQVVKHDDGLVHTLFWPYIPGIHNGEIDWPR